MTDVHEQERRSSGIFICYRRGIATGHALALKEHLLHRFPPPVFMDVDSITPATDWGEAIEAAIRSSGVMLVLIAKDWMQPRQADDSRSEAGLVPAESRLDDPEDYVRREIEAARQYNIPLIPVLIERTEPPPRDKVPASVRDLFKIQAIGLEAGPHWKGDVSTVLEAVERFVIPLSPDAPAQSLPPDRPVSHANLLVRGPLTVSVPLLIFAVNYLVGYKTHSAAWIALIATAALAALVAASEYNRSRIWVAALECNCLWFILFAIYRVRVQQYLPSPHWKFGAGLTLAGALINALFFIPALSSVLGKKRVVHPILPVFLGFMAAGLGIGSYAHIPGHGSLLRGGALVLFAAVAVNLTAPVLALARRSSARPAAGDADRSRPSPGPTPRGP